jgi:hypothetical protein
MCIWVVVSFLHTYSLLLPPLLLLPVLLIWLLTALLTIAEHAQELLFFDV